MALLNKDAHDSKKLNMLGIVTCLSTHVVPHEWVIDSGATHHVAAHKDVFSQCHNIVNTEKMVNLPTGAKEDISHIGEAQILNDETV